MRLAFGPFLIDERSRALSRDGEPVALTDRDASVLLLLVANAGSVVSKDALVAAGWGDVAVTDNSVEQAISRVRRILGAPPRGGAYIETVPRRGYRFTAAVDRSVARDSDASLDALLAPHRAWLEGRAALETLNRDQAVAAERAFEQVITLSPDYAPAYIGLANACAFRFESTRIDQQPDASALRAALRHAQEACRLGAAAGEAWATLAFVLHRAGDPLQAIAAARRAVALEPDNWRHHLRLAAVSWGEERLRAASRALHFIPGLALAHWLAASVHIARQAFDAAGAELDAGAAAQDEHHDRGARFSAVGLHWLRGLVQLSEGDDRAAHDSFQRELAFESSGHVYARECGTNTWYALGAIAARHGDHTGARRAFDEALRRVPGYLPALAARSGLGGAGERAAFDRALEARAASVGGTAARVQLAMARAACCVLDGRHEAAAELALEALGSQAGAAAGWLIPVEPLFAVSEQPAAWGRVLAVLRDGAA